MPALRHEVVIQAASLASGSIPWNEAYGAVIAMALARGAGRMADPHFDALADWIGSSLLHETDKAEAAAIEADALVPRCLRLPFSEARALVMGFLHGE